MTVEPACTREDLIAEIDQLKRDLAKAQELSSSATEYRVLLPEGGGTDLLLRRQVFNKDIESAWAVSVCAYGGGRAWTTEGWQGSISALSVDRLFCWPDAATALAEARNAIADGS